MTYQIGEYCIGCGECIHVCPVKAIDPAVSPYQIDPEKCTGCGTCVDHCAFGVITEKE